jgi:hypothetical protein
MWRLSRTSGTHIWELWWFELMYTLQGKTWPTYHMHPTLSLRMIPDHTYLTWSAHNNHMWSHQQWWAEPLLSRKWVCTCINPQHNGWPIRGSVLSFFSEPVIEEVGVKPPSVDTRLLGLLGTYHQHKIDTFNTCSQRLTHRSLTKTGGGYSLEGTGFPHTTGWPFQLMVLPFPPNGPDRSPV